ncbi:GNAT family N-acetyltransferase [Streptomyces justiciae]|uniref:GNAT family N-acetyltransferase n=1 Tax=Streptomyces justiciae TaxID=2780140 RepID=UPI00187E3D20|nr:GNAT family N-acetyltransferase [Streptomyces justiciae]MBE8476997.1 GNAT family N-acetyltransferase [Streptomyces justiciae]
MDLTYRLDPELTPGLLDQLTRLWVDVNNAGGAVGFVGTTSYEDVRPGVDGYVESIAAGRHRMLAGLDPEGRLRATAFFGFNEHRLQRHYAWLYTVMVAPALQGGGHGRALLGEAERHARGFGLEALKLTCRGGLGLERFYAAAGYKEVGRVPDGLRVAADDYRDDIMMWLPLS